MSEKKIADALGLRPLEDFKIETEEREILPDVIIEGTDIIPTPTTELADEVVDDIDIAKENIKDIITKGGDSLEEILAIAKQSENPRAFEVASNMMRMLVDANKEFVQMSEKKKFAKEEHPAPQTTNNVTNNNLILSTTDLLKMIKGEQ